MSETMIILLTLLVGLFIIVRWEAFVAIVGTLFSFLFALAMVALIVVCLGIALLVCIPVLILWGIGYIILRICGKTDKMDV